MNETSNHGARTESACIHWLDIVGRHSGGSVRAKEGEVAITVWRRECHPGLRGMRSRLVHAMGIMVHGRYRVDLVVQRAEAAKMVREAKKLLREAANCDCNRPTRDWAQGIEAQNVRLRRLMD